MWVCMWGSFGEAKGEEIRPTTKTEGTVFSTTSNDGYKEEGVSVLGPYGRRLPTGTTESVSQRGPDRLSLCGVESLKTGKGLQRNNQRRQERFSDHNYKRGLSLCICSLSISNCYGLVTTPLSVVSLPA